MDNEMNINKNLKRKWDIPEVVTILLNNSEAAPGGEADLEGGTTSGELN